MLVAGWIWVLTWPPYAFAPNLVTLGLANMVGWLIIPVVMSMQFSYRVSAIPDELQGGVNSVFKLMVFGSEPLALALAGVLTQSIGAPSTILVLTVPQAAIVIVATGNRSFRAARTTVAGRRT